MGRNPVRIFIVDDNVGYHALFCDIIEDDITFECVGVADSGELALERIPTAKPDIILLNYIMIDWRAGRYINGDTTLENLHEVYPNSVVIGTSAFPEAEDIMKAVGAVGFIPYPFKNSAVLTTLHEVADLYVEAKDE